MPEDVRSALEGQWGNLSRRLTENLALDGYRQGLLSLAQVRRLLGLADPLGSAAVPRIARHPRVRFRSSGARPRGCAPGVGGCEPPSPSADDRRLRHNALAPLDRDRRGGTSAQTLRNRDCARAVWAELQAEATPLIVKTWLGSPSDWLEVRSSHAVVSNEPALDALDPGERGSRSNSRRN